MPRGSQLQVFFTVIGDAPERMMFTTIDLTKGWAEWPTAPAVDVMRPQTGYECAKVPAAPTRVGDVLGRVQQMRDPHVFQDGGKTYLFYRVWRTGSGGCGDRAALSHT